VRAAQRSGGLGLADEALPGRFIVGDLGVDELDRHRCAQHQMLGPPDGAHAPFFEPRLETITPFEDATGHGGLIRHDASARTIAPGRGRRRGIVRASKIPPRSSRGPAAREIRACAFSGCRSKGFIENEPKARARRRAWRHFRATREGSPWGLRWLPAARALALAPHLGPPAVRPPRSPPCRRSLPAAPAAARAAGAADSGRTAAATGR